MTKGQAIQKVHTFFEPCTEPYAKAVVLTQSAMTLNAVADLFSEAYKNDVFPETLVMSQDGWNALTDSGSIGTLDRTQFQRDLGIEDSPRVNELRRFLADGELGTNRLLGKQVYIFSQETCAVDTEKCLRLFVFPDPNFDPRFLMEVPRER